MIILKIIIQLARQSLLCTRGLEPVFLAKVFTYAELKHVTRLSATFVKTY